MSDREAAVRAIMNLPPDVDLNEIVRTLSGIADARTTSGPADGRDDDETLWTFLGRVSGSIDGPPDWSAEHDHYLYGAPKRG